MNRSYFITATGTEIGKTFITCIIARQLVEDKKTVRVLKPIISGWDENENDTKALISAAQSKQKIEECSPWRFNAPLSPDMAGCDVSVSEIADFCLQTASDDYTLIEGAGGIMTPINSSETFLDLAHKLKAPVILVAGSYLGTISHTLTAIKAMAGLNIKALILNESETNPVSLQETARSIAQFYGGKIITVPRNAKRIEGLVF